MLAFLLALLPKLPAFNIFNPMVGIMALLTPTFAFVKKWWRFIVPVLLIATNCATIYEWRNTNLALTAEKAAHTRDINTFRTAQATANAAAEQIRQNLLKESKANADQADAQYATLLSQYRTNLLRYQANQSSPSPTQYYQLPATGSSTGPSTGTVVSPPPIAFSNAPVTISIDDANICAVNTARLQAVHDWALNQPKG